MNGAADDDLAALHAALWVELERCVEDKLHGWRTATLATLASEGVDARTVVLREVDYASQQLVFFTDARSPKVTQLRAAPEALLVAWCARLGWQLRLRVRAHVETEGLGVSSRWARLRLKPAAQDYLSPLPPGTLLAEHVPAPLPAARNHFALVRLQVLSLDWLGLRAGGHRRAQFDAQGARWLAA
ncbi:pyridoxamine 5'-phosphate oxidase family protein [Inhella proteolytica]|uniref:Pyridoxamine 5'-phosphate oxidase family protein n=1 Tax=Inhella proteolytica TaxID=2795029 RepID=A0A931J8G8_9BURK|nr:pyridoxamine 5'-phosphate oxidase family protein [Inhella proteolytica]MBH9578040.1 pyridoxamine 5'-phosphate oxidase family protein [Inhella proteolytica]